MVNFTIIETHRFQKNIASLITVLCKVVTTVGPKKNSPVFPPNEFQIGLACAVPYAQLMNWI